MTQIRSSVPAGQKWSGRPLSGPRPAQRTLCLPSKRRKSSAAVTASILHRARYRPRCCIFHLPVKRKRNKWTTRPLTLTWLLRACGDLSKVFAASTVGDLSLFLSWGLKFILEFLVLINSQLIFLFLFFFGSGDNQGHPVQCSSKWDEGKPH